MKQSYILLLILLIFAFIGGSNSITSSIDIRSKSKDYRNIRVLRVINLTASIVREQIGIHTKNTGSEPTSIYYFTIPAIYQSHLATYHAYLKQGSKVPLEMESVGLDSTK
jgi:hypothetical protein